jgi:hypothetical protein
LIAAAASANDGSDVGDIVLRVDALDTGILSTVTTVIY